MSNPKSNSELAILERSQNAFTNIDNQPSVASTMAEFGYDASAMDVGKAIYAEARLQYDVSHQEAMESKEAYRLFSENKEKINVHYRMLRKKAKVVYQDEPLMLQKLQVSGDAPEAYLNLLESVQQYCSVFVASEEVQQELARLKVTMAEVEETQADIKALQASRAGYIKERGEAQHATQLKDEAMARLDKWMRKFYAVAKIAFEDQPQLLETLGLVVKR
ncbi:hypothetical protein [Carboxylicivirga marina]|uniref:Uncharacterized protein n=1 Tax=Carboxylicivirga marina TaxID=2800988 RepID=A0ABS1HFC1_9BACT|nr:hypothetical protein [Carboxylicivirga marina]MBK3516362.1 hypothetical protein [Carboxylicivirga marina]